MTRSFNLLDLVAARFDGAIGKEPLLPYFVVSELHQELCENQQQGHKRV